MCGINQLQTELLIMDQFKTFCWNTVCARCIEKRWWWGGQVYISTLVFTSCRTVCRTRTFHE